MNGLNERTKRRIALLAGEDLGEDDDEAREVRRLIATCPVCRQYWMQILGCLDVLDRCDVSGEVEASSQPSDNTSPGVWREIAPRLQGSKAKTRRRPFNGWIPALSMAAACVVMLVAGQMDVSWRGEGNWAAVSGRAVGNDQHPGLISISQRVLTPAGPAPFWGTFGEGANDSFGGPGTSTAPPVRDRDFRWLAVRVEHDQRLTPRPMNRLSEMPFLVERTAPWGRNNDADPRIPLFDLQR